jgi:type 1 fimbria pilin
MAILTGNSGELRYRGMRIGKCRNFSIDISRDALETTVLGNFNRTYIEGLRGATGSATVLYDEDDSATVDLLNSIFRNDGGPQTVAMVLNSSTNKALQFQALLTQVGTPVSVGEVVACSLSFQVSGPLEGTF